MPSPLDATEPYADRSAAPLADSRRKRSAVLTWTDATGPQERTIDGALTIGSSPSCNIVIADPRVSRMHAGLRPTDEGIEIRDLGSKNGTYCDTLRVRDAILREETRIRLGPVELRLRRPEESLANDLWPRTEFGPLLGRSDVMRGLFQQLFEIAPSNETVMIRGETGTGKEGIAAAIHQFSKRRGGPIIPLDCSSLHPELLEAELFGHKSGSFTGAVQNRIGAFEAAEGGTLFLDEIGELPLAKQPAFLRALEARSIRRVGENEYRPVDVRVICASHRDLRELVNRGQFREDLYFRLAVIPIRVPPLRERLDDIPMLVEHFLPKGAPPPPLLVLEQLAARSWPGNVRELRNVVSRVPTLGWERALASDDDERTSGVQPSGAPVSAADANPFSGTLYEARKRNNDKFERDYMAALMTKYKGDVLGAAARAGVDTSYVRKLLKKHGV